MMTLANTHYTRQDVLDRDFRLYVADQYGPPKRTDKRRDYSYYNAEIIGRPEKTASLAIYPDGWTDYGNGESGSPFDFVMKARGLSFGAALAELARFYGLATGNPLPKLAPRPRREVERQDDPPPAAWQSIVEAVIKDCERRLWSPAGAAALAYLHNRGLTDDTIRALRLGFNPTWIKTLWQKSDGHFAQLVPGITLPWIADGHKWALKVRSLDPADDTKYRQLTDGAQSAALYNADAIQPGKPVFIVEGEFDAALIIQVAGDLVTPVTVGSASNSISDRWRSQLDQSPIMLATDNDTAGNKARDRLTEQFPSARIAPALPDGIKDVTDYWKAGGDVRQWVIDALATATPAIKPAPAVDSSPAPVKRNIAAILASQPNQSRVAPATCRDGIRSAALTCDLDAALIVRELAILAGKQPGDKITRPELKALNKQLGTNINERLIDRGVNQGAETNRQNQGKSLFFTTYSPDFVEKSGVAKKRAVEFTLLPDSEVKPRLKAMLVSRLAYRYYPLSGNPNDLLPLASVTPDVYRAVVSEIDSLTPEQSRQLRAALEDASGLQNPQDSGWRFEEYKSALRKLYRWLDSSHSTELPVGLWTNGAQFRAVFYRCVHDADPKNRSHRTIALLTGINPGNAGPIIERAALENHRQDPAIIRFPLTKTLSADIRRAAAQRSGKVDEVYALRDERRISASGFDVKGGRFQQWAEAQKRAGIDTVEVKMYVPAKQVAVGDVQPAKPRQKSAPKNSAQAENPAPPKPPVETNTRRRKAPNYLQWRDLLLETAYSRLTLRDGETAHSNLRSLIALALQTPVKTELTESEVSEPMYTPVEREVDQDVPLVEQVPEPQIDLSDFPKPPPPPSAETRAALARLELKRREDADRRLNPHLYGERATA